MVTGSFLQKQAKTLLAQQVRAWRFYGIPWPEKSRKSRSNEEPVGEVRYVVGWMADQMSRMGWTITVDGEETWSLKLPNGETVTVVEDGDGESLRDGSKKILDLIGWNPNVVRQLTVNYFVAGQCDYCAIGKKDSDEDPTWRVISVVHPDRDDIIEGALHTVPGLWPHPANPDLPDAPLFGVLPVLEDISWLSRLSRSQSASRISMRGILGVADGLSFANGGDFWQELLKSIKARMEDPTDVSPLVLRGAKALIEQDGAGMGGLSWVIPEFPYDNKIDDKITKLIQRLAYGLPIPPEILLGLSNQSRATAFQVEGNSYRAHIEPPAELIAALATEAISLLIPDKKIEVNPDPTELLARRHSVQDAKDALMVCAIGFGYYRQVLGIPDEAAPTAEELALLLTIFGKTPTREEDPSNTAANEPVTASVGGPKDEPLTDPQLSQLANMLASIDATLLMELGGATQQATDRAREKVGAKARTFPALRSVVPKDVPNERVAAYLGVQVLNDTGVPVADIVADAITPLLSWWDVRIRAARDELVGVLGEEADGALDDSFLTASGDLLGEVLAAHVIDTLESEVAQPLGALARRTVMAVAGGASL